MDKIIRTKEEPLIMVIYKSAGPRRLCHWHENGKVKRQYYSRWLWEKNNGKMPRNVVIVYKDGDGMNDCIENYEVMSKSEFMRKYPKDKDNSGYSKRWSKIAGDTDLEKLNTVLLQYDIRNFQQLNELTGIDLGQLSRIKNKGYGLGLTNIKRLFDAVDKINIV